MTIDACRRLHPRPGKPYLITAPAYETKSAGVKVLHLLCHALNLIGQRAYIVPLDTMGVSPNLITPYAAEDYDPENSIAVYPEKVQSNLLNCANVVRYLLYFAGVYGGPATFPGEMVWGYTGLIAEDAGFPNSLTLPVVDTEECKPPLPGSTRGGSCYYAHKYKGFYKGQTLPVTEHCTEITADMPRGDVIRLLQRSEVFYAYEDTTLIYEAALCGCPAVLLPTEHFTRSVALDEFARYGVAWGVEEMDYAKATVGAAREAYVLSVEKFWDDLGRFVELTQEFAK